MLANSPISPTIPVVDLDRAKRFYETTLGLKPVPANNDNTSGIATFEVTDTEEEVNALRGKGVVFEEYDMPEIKTQNGIATHGPHKAAWFKDSEGNILCIHQLIR